RPAVITRKQAREPDMMIVETPEPAPMATLLEIPLMTQTVAPDSGAPSRPEPMEAPVEPARPAALAEEAPARLEEPAKPEPAPVVAAQVAAAAEEPARTVEV